MNWTRFLVALLGTLVSALLACGLLIAVANPYGNMPVAVLGSHVIMDTNQRFQYHAIVRSGRFDSIVVGTSTSRLLRPSELERLFGGRFANLALDSGTAWEQHRMAMFFAAKVATPRTLVVGLDHVWCQPNADAEKLTPRGFPEWLYDDEFLNDLPNMLNNRTLEISIRRISHALGRRPARIGSDGYEVFLPPEKDFDLARSRMKIYGSATPVPFDPALRGVGPVPLVPAQRLPALAWLDRITDADQRWGRVVFLMTPIHAAALPDAGSAEAAREADCKHQIGELARRKGIPFVDFRRSSPIATSDENYWDPLHYRVPIADRIVEGVGRALSAGAPRRTADWERVADGRP